MTFSFTRHLVNGVQVQRLRVLRDAEVAANNWPWAVCVGDLDCVLAYFASKNIAMRAAKRLREALRGAS